jgi:hypothetical protein
MADLTVTEANVGLSNVAGAQTEVVQVAEAIAKGEVYYKDSSNSNKARLADADGTGTQAAVGIALTAAGADGDYIVGIKSGSYEPGATLSTGQAYYLSATAGKIAPYADLTTGDTVVSLFRATSTSVATVAIDNTGIEL